MENKQFVIEPTSNISGGSFSYAYDPLKKALSYVLDAGYFFFGPRQIHEEGVQHIDPIQLQSDRFNTVGAPIHFAALSGRIIHVQDGIATADLQMDVLGRTASATGTFDISQKYVSLVSLHAMASVFFKQYDLVVLPADVGSLAVKKKAKAKK